MRVSGFLNGRRGAPVVLAADAAGCPAVVEPHRYAKRSEVTLESWRLGRAVLREAGGKAVMCNHKGLETYVKRFGKRSLVLLASPDLNVIQGIAISCPMGLEESVEDH